MQDGVEEVTEALEKLYEVWHVVPAQRELVELYVLSVERLHATPLGKERQRQPDFQ